MLRTNPNALEKIGVLALYKKAFGDGTWYGIVVDATQNSTLHPILLKVGGYFDSNSEWGFTRFGSILGDPYKYWLGRGYTLVWARPTVSAFAWEI